MSSIKDYIQSLNEEGLSSHLKVGDCSGASSDPAVAEKREAPVMTETVVKATETQAADDQGVTDMALRAAEGQKSTNDGVQGKVVAVDKRVQAEKQMVVAPNKTLLKKVVPVEKKLELLSTPKAPNRDVEEVPRALQQVSESVVTITADGTAGRGFIFDQEGRIVTSCGLVRSASRVKVTIHSGDVFLGRVVGLDTDRDVAIIQIPTKTSQHLPIAATSVDVGESIFILNSASAARGPTRAVINAVRDIGGTMLIQIDQPIPPSDCGSPLVTEQGTVIGIVSEKFRQDVADTGFGVRLEQLDGLSA